MSNIPAIPGIFATPGIQGSPRVPGAPDVPVSWSPPQAKRVAEADPTGRSPNEPGAKLDAGKIQASVLEDFASALLAVAEVGTFGAIKYTRGGWQSVPNGRQRYCDAGWRHRLKARFESHDPDSKLLHKAHEAWNVLAELELMLRAETVPKIAKEG